MDNTIQVLSDVVANQIAAGEVVQRPASAVKELLENAVDSGATQIDLIIEDAGKTLIQVVDNGCGMSEYDALLCFERHATSKLRQADDLYTLHTMGFRGEALASIAGIAQVELRTRRKADELGTLVRISGSKAEKREACSCAQGTSISVKNLFYNVPARRQFLKSDNAEYKHISEEFIRIALIHPELGFSLHHNGKIEWNLLPTKMNQRIIALMGTNYNQRLVSLEQSVSFVKIHGYIIKPEYALKTRGEQYLFVNKRYIRHPYFHHAIDQSFKELISDKSFPGYFICMEVDPQSIDVNIHPTKTEVRFTDERAIYGVLNACVRRAIGINNLSPSIDFDQDPTLVVHNLSKPSEYRVPQLSTNPHYNPFETVQSKLRQQESQPSVSQSYLEAFECLHKDSSEQSEIAVDRAEQHWECLQVDRAYIMGTFDSIAYLIHQQRASERIIFERLMQSLETNPIQGQTLLFPLSIDFNPADCDYLTDILEALKPLGWDIERLGGYTFAIHARPCEVEERQVSSTLQLLLEEYKTQTTLSRQDRQLNIALAMSRAQALAQGTALTQEGMQRLCQDLFKCHQAELSPSGKIIYKRFDTQRLEALLSSKTI